MAVRIPLARYGMSTVAVLSGIMLAGTAACLCVYPAMAAVPLVAWAGVLMFFRDPERHAECGDADLLSPADGIVADVGEVEEGGFLHGRATRIGVFMSVFDVHVNRAPVSGTVRWTSHHPGKFHDARSEASLRENEHCFVGLEMGDGRRVLVNQVAGFVARRIVCGVSDGDALERGERFGMIKFGSRVELYLPATDEHNVTVEPGDRVRAGLTVVARWGSGCRDTSEA
jgi:phosphatidylserine decarboxylase